MPKGETDKQTIARMAREMRVLQYWLIFFIDAYTVQITKRRRT